MYFWTPDGRRYLDFNSQLMCVNAGHGDARIVRAIQEQAAHAGVREPVHGDRACAAELGAKLAEIAPGDIDVFFFTNGGADANENAIKIARAYTGRHKILARYRSYHGGTVRRDGADRRTPALEREPASPGVVHVLDPYTASRAAGTAPRSRWRCSKRSSSSKGRTRSPRSSSRP